MPFWAAILSFCAAGFAFCLAAWLLSKRHYRLHSRTALVLVSTGFVSFSSGLLVSDVPHIGLWLRMLFWGEFAQVAAFSWLASVYCQEQESSPRVVVIAMLSGIFSLLLFTPLIIQLSPFRPEESLIVLGPLGRVAIIFVLTGMVFGLAQIEGVLRGLRDPLRYQTKFILIGLGGVAGYQVYVQTQLLLMPVWDSNLFLAGAVIQFACLGLVVFGVTRLGSQEVSQRLYISPQALVGSLTVVFAGLYLMAVGGLANWLRGTGREIGPVVSLVAAFCGAVALVIVAASRSTRAAIHVAVARHFFHSKYDYRLKWLEVTEAFRGADSVDTILDRLCDLVGHTFGASKISIWLRFEADHKFHQVRSLNTGMVPLPIDEKLPSIKRLEAVGQPMLDDILSSSDQRNRRAALLVPILCGRRLLAFISLSRDQEGREYGVDDCDLLRAIASHVGLLLANAQLAEERTTSVELEALHKFSAFCLHDLKNLAGKLSLVAQNAQVHGGSPAFQQAAMKTVSSTVQQMAGLITKLSLKPVQLQNQELVDANALIVDIIDQLKGDAQMSFVLNLRVVPPILVAREQFQQVLLNIILNAKQAGREKKNTVTVETLSGLDTVILIVADQGAGIAPDRLRTLFLPFQTSKKEGMGIGLYQCKQMIEAHGGTILVQSQLNAGTTIRITLPVAKIDKSIGHQADAEGVSGATITALAAPKAL